MTYFNKGNKKEARRIVDAYIIPQMENNHWEQPDDLKDGHDMTMADKYLATGVNLSALMQIGGADEAQIKGIVQWLMGNRSGYEGLWGSTRQSSQVLFALLTFIQKYQEFNPEFRYTLALNGKEIDSGRVAKAGFNKKLEVPVSSFAKNNTVDVKIDGQGSLYYTVNVKNYVDASKIENPAGLSVERTYYKDGKPVTEFAVGDVLEVKLKVKSDRALRR